MSNQASPAPIVIGPNLGWPAFPKLKAKHRLTDPKHNAAARINVRRNVSDFRRKYDWTLYTPEALEIVEGHWDEITALLASFLPERLQQPSAAIRGINLGTFNGAFQKAWMRRGYSMYGVEIASVIDELHAYGCEGHQDNIFTLPKIADGTFDFGVLDRVICNEGFYSTKDPTSGVEAKGVPPFFKAIVRILKPGGSLIGILYGWYTRLVIEELASYGSLKLWPVGNEYHLGFQVDLAGPPSVLPDVGTVPFDSEYFRTTSRGHVFIPTNEIVEEISGVRKTRFFPTGGTPVAS